MNPLEGALTNPLLAVGLQILNNNRRVPRSQYQGPFAGVTEALMGAAYQKRMLQQQGMQEEMLRRQKDEWRYQDDQRSRRDQAMSALQGALGQQSQDQMQGQQLWNESMADEPASVQAMGAPQYPANPLNPQAIQSIMMGGDSAMQNSAITSALQGQKPNRTAVVNGNLVDTETGRLIYSAPADPTALTFEQRKELAALRGGASNGEEYLSAPIVTANGAFSVYQKGPRIGQIVPLQSDGKPILPASADPALKGAMTDAETTARVTAENTTKREFGMRDLRNTVQMARNILDGKGMEGKGGSTPTHSGLGTAVDATAGFFGVGTDGGDAAAQLKSIGGVLTSKMPRMEGPQSDADRIQYAQMAGEVGNSMLPISRRKAALDVIEKLWAKYDKSGEVGAGGNSPGDGGWAIRPVQ